ncbi:Kelch repeat-containing protein 3 [Leucoagaricus sp. SymC.cos]|nr:Kelch repeat-containing protein 3 [Leucoagaricus sp. SymC.cos]
MAKKKATNAAAKAAKKARAAQKTERKEKKKVNKSKSKYDSEDEDDQDLEAILEKMRKEWEQAHTVTEELVEGPPSRRANATLTPCPNGNHLWCIGGEFFSEDGKAYFYNDVFRYTPERDEWRKFVSPTCPGPRSAHAVASSPAGGGKLFLFGGEFSSLHQTTFHHYRDFWCFDIGTHSWDRIDTKIRPSARSGHRMATWKHYIILFGGFYDPGVTTRYLNDLWVFDTQEYKWMQIEFRETDPKPSPRSGFSFLPCAEGILLHGGYCKEYVKGKRPIGVMLEDTWLLKVTIPTTEQESSTAPSKPSKNKGSQPQITFKWERRKRASDAYAPSLRSGCTMALWNRSGGAGPTGILFGGVTDDDTNEETLESVFHNDLYGYQIGGKGKWVSMALKKPKAKGGKKVTRADKRKEAAREANRRVQDSDEDEDDDVDDTAVMSPKTPSTLGAPPYQEEKDSDDPNLTLPIPRYNAMLAVLRNTLYIYGGIFEKGSKEYTLDDFYSLQLDKLDRFTCLKESVPKKSKDKKIAAEEEPEVPVEEQVEEVAEVEDPNSLRSQANAFMGVSKDITRSAEDVMSTPLPGETLAMFYARSREYWSQKAFGTSENRGKELRRDGFGLAEERYAEYKPILEEVEKILAEAGLDEEEMRRGTALGGGPAASGQSRNRR